MQGLLALVLVGAAHVEYPRRFRECRTTCSLVFVDVKSDDALALKHSIPVCIFNFRHLLGTSV